MKKKYYFIISGLIQIIASVYAIVDVNTIVSEFVDAAAMYPEGIRERVINLYQNSGSTFIIILSCICILLNMFIIYCSLNNKLLRKKETILGLSIVSLFTANYTISELFAILNIIIIASMKRTNPEDYPDKDRRNIPTLKMESVTKKKKIMAIVLLIIYFSQIIMLSFIPKNIGLIVQLIFYVLMIILSIYVFYDILKRDFYEFRNNLGAYLRYIFPKLGIFYLIYIAVSLVILAISKSTAANQNALESLPIWFTIPAAIIYAPIVEEMLFRASIRRFIKNEKIYILVSGVIFGLLHTVFSETSIFNVFIMAIPYGVMGAYLAYIYTKTNNLCTNIFSHAFNNTIAMIISILIMGF